MDTIGPFENPCRDIDKIHRGLFRLETCNHPDDDFVFRNTPFLKLRSPRTGLYIFIDVNAGAREDPFAAPCQAKFLRLLGIFIGYEHVLRRDFRSQALQPDIELPHDGPLKIIETKSVCRVKDEGNSCEPGGPPPQNSGFWTMRVNEDGALAAEDAPHFNQRDEV